MKTLYERLGGYDAITAVANGLLPRLQTDPHLGRFWAHRGEDGVKREKQLLIDFLCASAGRSSHAPSVVPAEAQRFGSPTISLGIRSAAHCTTMARWRLFEVA